MRTPTTILQGCGVLAAGLTMACASAPRQEYIESKAALEAAERIEAGQHPKAAYHLKLARDKIATAEPLMDKGGDERETARFLLVEAKKDADVAMEYAQTETMLTEVERAQEQIADLQGSNMLEDAGQTPSYINEPGGGPGMPGARTEEQRERDE